MAKWSLESKVGDLVKDPEVAAILEKLVPGITTNPQTKMVHGMTLKAVAGFPQAGISKEKLAEIDAALQALE